MKQSAAIPRNEIIANWECTFGSKGKRVNKKHELQAKLMKQSTAIHHRVVIPNRGVVICMIVFIQRLWCSLQMQG